MQVFSDFYLSKHSGRRLAWQHSLGQCIVRAHFPKGDHELAVSLTQVLPDDLPATVGSRYSSSCI